MLIVLLGLGTWQVERLAWKTALLAQIDRAERLPAIPMDDAPAAPFTKVRVDGMLRPDLSVLYGAEGRDTAQGPRIGGQLVSVLERPGAAPLLVDRGWVEALPTATSPMPVSIEGYLRPGDRAGVFAATDNPASRRFYTLDPAAIGAALGLPSVADFVLVALGPAPPGGPPEPAQALPRPPNNHLSYVITWYGLALALLVIFIVYARKKVPRA
jgi:surfeit locus 1 family protein